MNSPQLDQDIGLFKIRLCICLF